MQMDNFKVIFHINESNKWNTLLANVSNLIKDLGNENVTIEVLANGSAVTEYISAEISLNDALVFAHDFKYIIDYKNQTATREDFVVDIVF
jgi:intracellular sulfur oxidation DsrE/DsrF family protein